LEKLEEVSLNEKEVSQIDGGIYRVVGIIVGGLVYDAWKAGITSADEIAAEYGAMPRGR